MKYRVIYPDGKKSSEFPSFTAAMEHLDAFPLSTPLSLETTAYSPITAEEAEFYCESYEEESELYDLLKTHTPEEALRKLHNELFSK